MCYFIIVINSEKQAFSERIFILIFSLCFFPLKNTKAQRAHKQKKKTNDNHSLINMNLFVFKKHFVVV